MDAHAVCPGDWNYGRGHNGLKITRNLNDTWRFLTHALSFSEEGQANWVHKVEITSPIIVSRAWTATKIPAVVAEERATSAFEYVPIYLHHICNYAQISLTPQTRGFFLLIIQSREWQSAEAKKEQDVENDSSHRRQYMLRPILTLNDDNKIKWNLVHPT